MRLAAALALMLVSCSEEQSVFNIDHVPGKAKIRGTVTYNEGTTLSGGRFVYDYKPAVDLKVFVEVDNSIYGSNFSGITVFETLTDEAGKYEIEIPAPAQSVSAVVYTEQFEGNHISVQRVNNVVTTVSENVVYGAYKSVDIRSHGIVYGDMVCVETSNEELPDTYYEYATLEGRVGKNMEYKVAIASMRDEYDNIISYRPASLEYYYDSAANADLILTVNYNNKEFHYNTTTDSQGRYSFQLPVREFPATLVCSMEVVPVVSSFTTYERTTAVRDLNGREITLTDYEPRSISGWFEQSSVLSNTFSYAISSVRQTWDVKALVFEPYEDQNTYNYSAYNFRSAAWFEERSAE